MLTNEIIFFYAIGLLFFILGFEEKTKTNDLIYMGLAFFINYIGYELSYSNPDYIGLAYLPLVLMMLSVIFLLYKAFLLIKSELNDDYKDDAKDDE